MRLPVMVFMCLLVQTHCVTMGEHSGDDDLVHQLNDIFDSASPQDDLGETAQVGEEGTTESEAAAPPLPPVGELQKKVSFHFKKEGTDGTNLGESQEKSDGDGPEGRARRMIRLGNMLKSLDSSGDQRSAAVSSLNEALHTKLLMDELHPHAGSYGKKQGSTENELGEDHDENAHLESFSHLLHEHKKNMADITKFLMERKKIGRPLTTKEDDELQKFYYNRASTILKKIVLLKRGEAPPAANDDDEESDQLQGMDSADEESSLAKEQTDAAIARLNFDAKVANANARYNKKMLAAKHARMKAALQSREKAYADSSRAAEEKMKYDKKVADAEKKYNQALSDELLKEKSLAEEKVQAAAAQKKEADIAAEKATAEADAADKEADEAEKEAEEATKRAQELEAEAERDGQMVPSEEPTAPKKIPLSVVPHTNIKAMLRYLQTALDHHMKITPAEQQLMQSYFLKQGSALLSQLAQVDPDATWHSKGVVEEEQYEMDNHRPDQLSKEWGSKHLQGSTVMRDFMGDLLHGHKSNTEVRRPDKHQQGVGVFGNNAKLPLMFAPDLSHPVAQEPSMDLGESDDNIEPMAHKGALSAMMGIMDEDDTD